jgi:hypothetical protein
MIHQTICDDLSNKHLRRTIRTFFWIIGLVPYFILGIVVAFVWDNYYVIVSPFSLMSFMMSLSIVGSWTTWYLLCKVFNYFIILQTVLKKAP